MACCIKPKNNKAEEVPYKAGEENAAPKPAVKTNKIKATPVEDVKEERAGGSPVEPTQEERRESQASVDVLAPVKEAERKAAEKEFTEEEKADKAEEEAVEARVEALNADPESAQAYRKESLASEAEIGFVTISEDHTNASLPSSPKGAAMPEPKDESETKKLEAEEPIIPHHNYDPNQILVGGAGGFD